MVDLKIDLSKAREVSKDRKKGTPFTRVLREFSFIFTWILGNLGLSANMVTYLGLFTAISGSIFFLSNSVYLWVLGWGFYVFYILMDCVDGDLAVINNNRTDYGAFLDKFSHPVTNSFLVLFTAIGAYIITGNLALLTFSSIGALMFVLTAYLDIYSSDIAEEGGEHSGVRISNYRNPINFVKSNLFGPGGLLHPLIGLIVIDLFLGSTFRVFYPVLATIASLFLVAKRFRDIKNSM